METASNVVGSRFYYLKSEGNTNRQRHIVVKNENWALRKLCLNLFCLVYWCIVVALLELALINYSMSFLIRRGFTPILPPDLIQHQFVEACGFQPRSIEESQVYKVKRTQTYAQMHMWHSTKFSII